jgi:GntR family transcriptional regulator / MocR family aminotransferase
MSPRPPAQAPSLFVELDPARDLPLFRQLYGGIRDAVLGGRLPAGTRLPPSRGLATELGVSRNTVTLAYDQLVAEGYLRGRPRSGMQVATTLPPQAGPKPVRSPRARVLEPPRISARGLTIASAPMPGLARAGTPPAPFRPGVPALDLFPLRLWSRLVHRRLRRPPPLGYGEPAGYAPLRAAIAEYVSAARGARCVADQVIVVNGSQQGVDLAARVLLDAGDEAWMEDPGYPGARAALLAAGATLVPVPVDDEGLRVAEGMKAAPRARLAYVSPSHQFPLGATMSASRRLELLRWAAQAGAWILEDDYDSEFRYSTRPLASLQGMDQDGRVVYIGTFSKTLLPALRLGYLVVPPGIAHTFRAVRAACDRHSPVLDQAVLADFMTEGHFARHVRRMRNLYAERQGVLVDAIQRSLGGRLEARATGAGMHLVGWLKEGSDDGAVSARLWEAGIEAPALSRFGLVRPGRPGLLLGWAGYTPEAIERSVERLAAALN